MYNLKIKPMSTTIQNLPKIAVVKKEVDTYGWNKHLLTPLKGGDKVIISSDQINVAPGYVKIKHGKGEKKVESVFSQHHFETLTGKGLHKC